MLYYVSGDVDIKAINKFAFKYDDFAVVTQPCGLDGTAADLTTTVVSTVIAVLFVILTA